MQRITVAYGDGIGPEIMTATLEILKSAGAKIEVDVIEIGEQVYLSGNMSGIEKEAWNTIRRNKIFLKAPITTPQGSGYKSLNVSTRKFLGLYANVRPCVSYHPFVATKHPNMDVVIIRENEEDLYAGIEHQQTDEVVQCLKLISRPGCERIVRYAFEYAKQYGRRRVTCMTKDNIMKQTDGLFHSVFKEIGREYPEIEQDHFIIDIGAARLADTPGDFDVVVTSNLYGDIISDVTAQIAGSVGLAGSGNIGLECAMFEAIHGSAPTIAAQNIANPSGLINGAIMMLNHIGQSTVAEAIQNSLLYTIESGVHTADIYNSATSKELVGTKEFSAAVISNLGKSPVSLPSADYSNHKALSIPPYIRQAPKDKKLVGVDLFVHWPGDSPDALATMLNAMGQTDAKLSMITNRGIKVWPDGFGETLLTDHWRCRFQVSGAEVLDKSSIVNLLLAAHSNSIDVIKTENLYTFDGVSGYSMGQGQ
jgi:isocitrate dehydrogenase